MFPIGRAIAFEGGEKTIKDIKPGDINFIFSNPGCGDNAETHTVREWLGEFGIPIDDSYFLKWNQIISKLSSFLKTAEKKFASVTVEMIRNIMFNILFCEYDTNEDFLLQFEKNTEMFWMAMKKFGYKERKHE